MNKMNFVRYVGNNIMRLRESAGYEIREFSEKLGITYQCLWSIEEGRNYPSLSFLLEASKILRLSIDDIVGVKLGVKKRSEK